MKDSECDNSETSSSSDSGSDSDSTTKRPRLSRPDLRRVRPPRCIPPFSRRRSIPVSRFSRKANPRPPRLRFISSRLTDRRAPTRPDDARDPLRVRERVSRPAPAPIPMSASEPCNMAANDRSASESANRRGVVDLDDFLERQEEMANRREAGRAARYRAGCVSHPDSVAIMEATSQCDFQMSGISEQAGITSRNRATLPEDDRGISERTAEAGRQQTQDSLTKMQQ